MANISISAYDSNSIQTLLSSLNTGSKKTSSVSNWGINLAGICIDPFGQLWEVAEKLLFRGAQWWV